MRFSLLKSLTQILLILSVTGTYIEFPLYDSTDQPNGYPEGINTYLKIDLVVTDATTGSETT